MTSPLVPALGEPDNLGGQVINNSLTLGQLRLLAKCVDHSLNRMSFVRTLTTDEIEEAQALVNMFNDPELAKPDAANVHHGFCL